MTTTTLTPSPRPAEPRSRSARRVALATAILMLAVLAIGPTAVARAATPSPRWSVLSVGNPTNFIPGDQSGNEAYLLYVTNVGGGSSDGSAVTITDTLPAGVTAGGTPSAQENTGLPVSCTTTPVQCTLNGAAPPGDTIQMYIPITIDANATGTATNQVTVSGGGAPDASATSQDPFSATPAPFAINDFSFDAYGADGQPDTQAGDHPTSVTTTLDFNTEEIPNLALQQGQDQPAENVKDIVVDLPLGMVGDPEAAPKCPLTDLVEEPSGTFNCPADTVIGAVTIRSFLGVPFSPSSQNPGSLPLSYVYNMVPEHGHAAQFGFLVGQVAPAFMYASVVHTNSGYVLRVTAPNIPAQVDDIGQDGFLNGLTLTFFGNPEATDGATNQSTPFFTMPAQCSGSALTATAHVDTYEHPGRINPDGTPDFSDPNWLSATSSQPPVSGCDALSFSPALSVQPDTTVADSPSGLHVDLQVPQSEDQSSLGTPPLNDASVTLPAGFTVNPSAAAGLQACTPAEIDLQSTDPPSCPQASQIGTVQLTTPLLPGTLPGEIYLASEFNNPFNSLLAGYIVVDDPITGVVLKIPGNLTPNPVTGQITGVFDNNPQLPFSDLKLDFKGGPTGVLATPENCGTFTSNADLSPWSAPDSGPDATSSSSFSIDSGCVSGFSPTFTAGTQNAQAGAYSPFVLSMSRSDTDQNFQGLSVKLPQGMLAKLAGVSECSEADLAAAAASTGTQEQASPSCPSSSQVGTVETGAGVGSSPYFLPGSVYLTGPYKGAPYGLAIVVPAVAGPFDLGTVVVRQALQINPETAQVTDVSDSFPTILDGIPLDIRRIDVDLDRPGFTVNPTSCTPSSVSGTATSTGGLTANVSSRFQVGGCAALAFSPKLKIGLSGKGQTKSDDHPTLTATLTQGRGQANIHSAKVTLPLSMALDPNNSNHVCKYSVATAVHGGAVGCPTSTIVGKATADTPLLSKRLTGNVYLVQGLRCAKGRISAQGTCPGGKTAIHTLPTLLVPLRGQIALDLRAKSSVNGAGALVTTFSTIPDAPVSKFTLKITGGKKGLLVITGRGETICGKPQVASENLGAQSGKTMAADDTLTTPCKASRTKKR